MDGIKDWYLTQSPRDRLIINVVAALSAVALFFVLIWHPLGQRKMQLEQALVAKQDTLQFIQQAARQLNNSQGGQLVRKTSDKAPYLLIDQVIREASIEPPQRVEPSGSDGARVQFNDVEFDKLVGVLAELELYGLQVSTLTISRREQGMVSARFNMERS